MYWRLKVDPPHTYATEQGSIHSRYATDFRLSPGCFDDTWRDPVSGLVMLNPSFRKRDYHADFKDLGYWLRDTTNIDHWKQAARSMDGTALFSNSKEAGGSFFLATLLSVSAGIATFNANNTFYDNLQWALESKFTLSIDEGFAIHYHGLTDEILRKNNWFAVQWDNIYIHLSHGGHVTVCKYADRGDISGTPETTHEFDIAEPGALLGKSGYFAFIPMPGYGLMMIHTEGSATHSTFQANASTFSIRNSHLIPWEARFIGSHYRLFETSQVRIALNPYHANAIGFQNITYAASGTYVEEKFDPGYRPSSSPDDVSALLLLHFGGQFGSVTPTLKNADNSGTWAAGTDRQGRLSFALTTSDSRYSPIVYGWGVQWDIVTATRDAGELTLFEEGYDSGTGLPHDILQGLEFTTDSEGNFEGTANILARSPELIQKLERGDATFQIEYCDPADDPDVDANWTVYNGGILKVESHMEMRYQPEWGFEWVAEVNLHGQEERFEELHHRVGTAFDNLTIAEAINLILTTSGFAAIPEADLPGPATNRTLPKLPKGTNFRFAPQLGDSLKKILRDLMLMVRAQWVECKLVYDWENEEWTLVQRSRDTTVTNWTLTYDETQEDFPNRIAYYQALKLLPHPPEANLLQVLGMSSNDPEDAQIVPSTPIRNIPSLDDPDSDDYAGRVKSVDAIAPQMADVVEVNRMARTIEPRIMHRKLEWLIQLAPCHGSLDILPDTYVTILLPPIVGEEMDGDREFNAWVKKVTVKIVGDDHTAVAGEAGEVITLYIDEAWENAFRAEAE